VNILIPTSAEIDGQIVRMTKTNYSRYADLVPAGQSFIKWWADKFHDGEIPENEKVFFSRRILDRLKKEWGHWQQDVSRHTFLSNAVVHYDSVEYWSQRAGHSEAVFKSYYQRPRNESQAKAYFDLRAEDIIIKSKD